MSLRGILEKMYEDEKTSDPNLGMTYNEWLEFKREEEKFERRNKRSVILRRMAEKAAQEKVEQVCRCWNCNDPYKRNPEVKYNDDGSFRKERLCDRIGRKTSWEGPAKRTEFGYGYKYDEDDVPLPYTLYNPHSSCSLKDPDNIWSTNILIPLEITYHWDRCYACQERWPKNPRKNWRVTGDLGLEQKAYLFSLLDKIDLIECGFDPETFESGNKENEFDDYKDEPKSEIGSEDGTRDDEDTTANTSFSFEVLDDDERRTSSTNDGTWEVLQYTSNASRSFVVLDGDESNAASNGTSGFTFSSCSMNRS